MEKLNSVEQTIFNGANDEYKYDIKGDSQDFSASSGYSNKKAANLPNLPYL